MKCYSEESRKVEIETPQEESRKDHKKRIKPNSIGIELRNSNISGVFGVGTQSFHKVDNCGC